MLKEHVNVGTVPCILDLLIQWYPLFLIPAAPTAYSLQSRADIHAHVSTARACPLHLELIADFRTVTHREVIDHEKRVHIVPFLDQSFLLLAEDGLLPQVRTDHETIALLSERHDRLPDVHLGDFRVQHDLLYDRSNVFEVLWRRCCAPVQRLRHVIARTKWKRNKDDLANVD